ncbi:MAG: hypothetical protein KF705_03385 [Phycisphaeraceae bacterium]|nr:hypothetical protein [Phycisphaeraceae bacterium]
MSADASVIVGESIDADGVLHAFIWTPTDGMSKLGDMDGHSAAYAVSADGAVVVGNQVARDLLAQQRGWFRWTRNEELQTGLGILSGNTATLTVSADGSVVAGPWRNASGEYRYFRWSTKDGTRDIGPVGHNLASIPISADGSVIIGHAPGNRTFRWTEAKGAQDLGTWETNANTAPGSSKDGSATVGHAANRNVCIAHAVSANGSVVVGQATSAAGQLRAFRWSQ